MNTYNKIVFSVAFSILSLCLVLPLSAIGRTGNNFRPPDGGP